jgi:uncharacterized HAD superfamily protein
MNIGLDLDEVCCALMASALSSLRNDYGVELTLEDFENYNFYECSYTENKYHNRNIAEYLDAITRDTSFLLSAKPFVGVKKTLSELKSRGHSIHIVTARTQGEENNTKAWLKKHKLKVDSVTHISRGQSKGLIGKELSLDIFVDDYVPNIESMLEHSPGTQNFLLAKPWGIWYSDKRVKKIKTLNEIL